MKFGDKTTHQTRLKEERLYMSSAKRSISLQMLTWLHIRLVTIIAIANTKRRKRWRRQKVSEKLSIASNWFKKWFELKHLGKKNAKSAFVDKLYVVSKCAKSSLRYAYLTNYAMLSKISQNILIPHETYCKSSKSQRLFYIFPKHLNEYNIKSKINYNKKNGL